MKDRFKIIISDDNKLFANALTLHINESEHFKVVETFYTIKDTIQYTNMYDNIDLLILDLSFKGVRSIDYIKEIKPKDASFKVMCLTTYDNNYIKEEAISLGIDFFCSKDNVVENLLDFLEDIYINNTEKKIVLDTEKNKFSNRQVEIIKAYSLFSSDTDVANYLNISINTLKTHKRNLFEKTNCKNNLELLKFGIKEGIIVV